MENMGNEFVSYIKKIVMKALLHCFWIYPAEKNKITLLNELSFTYGDSMKYIDKYIHTFYEGKYKVVFPIMDGSDLPEYPDDLVVRPGSYGYFKELLTSGTIITNAGGVSYLPKRKRQKIISTWHGGGPYKKSSTDVYNDLWYKKQSDMNSNNTDYILSTCRSFSEIEARSMGYNDKKIIPAGLPRNDILFCDHSELKAKVRKYYNIPEDYRFVLFAPTYRSKYNEFSNTDIADDYIELNIDMLLEALKTKFGCEWICGIRLHPKLADVDMSGMNAINCTSYPDMQELLCCADAVITDYSSLMWDFSFTYRPIFLYAPDIEEYERKRGFYMPASKWPYPIGHNNDEMRANILSFDEEQYVRKIKKHHLECESYETGCACEKILELIQI